MVGRDGDCDKKEDAVAPGAENQKEDDHDG